MHLKGFLWSVGRCGTKAFVEAINGHTDARSLNWIDSPNVVESPEYFGRLATGGFVPTLHQPQLCDKFAQLVQSYPDLPVVYSVRDPISNLRSFAEVFLSSFIGRRIDEIAAFEKKGGAVEKTFNPELLDQLVLPSADIWGHYKGFKDSPHLIVEFSEIGEASFVETMTRVNEFLGLETTTPIVWPGVSNRGCDKFFVFYTRAFQLFDRNINLYFTRWKDYWPEQNLKKIGTLKSTALDPVIGEGEELQVLASTSQLCTEDLWAFEMEAFDTLFSDAAAADKIADQVVADYEYVTQTVAREAPAIKNKLCAKFDKTYRNGVRRFLKEHPDYLDLWTDWSARYEKEAA